MSNTHILLVSNAADQLLLDLSRAIDAADIAVTDDGRVLKGRHGETAQMLGRLGSAVYKHWERAYWDQQRAEAQARAAAARAHVGGERLWGGDLSDLVGPRASAHLTSVRPNGARRQATRRSARGRQAAQRLVGWDL